MQPSLSYSLYCVHSHCLHLSPSSVALFFLFVSLPVSYFYLSHSFQDVLFFPSTLSLFLMLSLNLLQLLLLFQTFLLLSLLVPCISALYCTVCVCGGGGIKRIWDGRVEVRSRGKVKDKRIVEVKGKKGRWGWGVWHCSLHSAAIQLYLAEGMETFLSRATASLEADFFSGVKAGETEILTTSGTCQMSGNISCLWAQQRVRSLPFSGKSNTFQSWNGYSWIQRHIHKWLLFVKMPSEVRGLRGYICSWCAEGVLTVLAAEVNIH